MKSEWQLEMYALSALPADEQAAFDQALQEDPALRERLDLLHAANAQFFADHPADLAVARIQRRASGARVQSLSWRLAGMTALLVAFLVPTGLRRPAPTRTEPTDSVRLKGAPALLIYRQSSGQAELLGDGAVAKRGEVLQLAYHSAGERFGAILSVDGRGHVTQHFPEASQHQAAALEDKANLPFAYELDDAPEFERFYFFTARDPFAVAPLLESLERGIAPTLLPGISVKSVMLRKERP
jgi:anti-sigma factor RsiW